MLKRSVAFSAVHNWCVACFAQGRFHNSCCILIAKDVWFVQLLNTVWTSSFIRDACFGQIESVTKLWCAPIVHRYLHLNSNGDLFWQQQWSENPHNEGQKGVMHPHATLKKKIGGWQCLDTQFEWHVPFCFSCAAVSIEKHCSKCLLDPVSMCNKWNLIAYFC